MACLDMRYMVVVDRVLGDTDILENTVVLEDTAALEDTIVLDSLC